MDAHCATVPHVAVSLWQWSGIVGLQGLLLFPLCVSGEVEAVLLCFAPAGRALHHCCERSSLVVL